MKTGIAFCSAFVFAFGLASAQDIPHLRKQGTATQLIVDGKPFLALAGELHNSSATSLEYMKPVWGRLAEAKLNTVLAGVSWNQIEPQEGKFDFSVLDGVIQGARSNNLISCPMVRKLEERSLQLPARLGKEGLQTLPAHPGTGRQDHRAAFHVQRCHRDADRAPSPR